MPTDYRNFLALSYDQLEELNLEAKAERSNRVAAHEIREKRLKYLTDEKRIKAVTVLFTDLEGRLPAKSGAFRAILDTAGLE